MRMLSLKSDLYTSPWNFERPSVNNCRMIVTHSRIAVTGLRYDAPCHRSTIIGLDTPRPANRAAAGQFVDGEEAHRHRARRANLNRDNAGGQFGFARIDRERGETDERVGAADFGDHNEV